MSILKAMRPPTDNYPFHYLPLHAEDVVKVTTILTGRVHYHMGAKAVPLDVPLLNLTRIDCSGFVRKNIFESLRGWYGENNVDELSDFINGFPDGSVAQHTWLDNCGVKKAASWEDGLVEDDGVRVAVLPPDSPLGPGERHIMLLQNGWTCESHGSTTGVSRRKWSMLSFARYCTVYVLTPPSSIVKID